MPALGNLFKSLAEKAGLKTDDENLKKVLSAADAMQLEVPEEVANALEQNLLTIDSATANQSVRGKLFAEALNGLDNEMHKSLDELELDDNLKGEIKGVKNTHEKYRKLITSTKERLQKIKEEAKKANPNDDAAKKALENQIAQLNTELGNLKTMHSTEIENLRQQSENQRRDFTMRSALAGKPLPNNGLPADVNILTANTLISTDMQKNGLRILFDSNGNPVLKQVKDGAEVDFYLENKPVTFDSYIDRVLATNKFIQVNDPNQKGGNNGQQQPQQQPGGGGGVVANASAVSEIDSQLASMGGTV